MGTLEENKIAYRWRVSEDYWLNERKLVEKDYEQIILGCTAGNAGFCESCMGRDQCEIRVLGYEKWREKIKKTRQTQLVPSTTCICSAGHDGKVCGQPVVEGTQYCAACLREWRQALSSDPYVEPFEYG